MYNLTPLKRAFFQTNLPHVRSLTPQALQSGINLSRQTEQHYSLATQILVSHSNDESLPHTMSSVINPPITSVSLNSLMCCGDQDSQDPLVLPDCASCNRDKQLGPTTSLYSASLLCSTQTRTHVPTNHQSQFSTPHCALPDNPPEMFSSRQVPAVIVQEQRMQQNNNHMIRNVGYVKAVRIKLFELLLMGSFICCFHFTSRRMLAQYLNCSVTLTEN